MSTQLIRTRISLTSRLAVLACLAATLLSGCLTATDVREIVNTSNAALLAEAANVSAESLLANDTSVGATAATSPAAGDDRTKALAQIHEFIERYPDRKATINPLLIRKAFLHLAGQEWNQARLAFGSFDESVAGNTRDLALKRASEALIWWWRNRHGTGMNAPALTAFDEPKRVLDKVVKETAPSGVRHYLNALRAHVMFKRAQLESVAGKPVVMRQALIDYASIFETAEQNAAIALFAASPNKDHLKNIAPDSIRWLGQARVVRDMYRNAAPDLEWPAEAAWLQRIE